MLALSYFSEITGELTFTAMFGQIWALPLLVWLYKANTKTTSKWATWAVTTVLLSYPSGELAKIHY